MKELSQMSSSELIFYYGTVLNDIENSYRRKKEIEEEIKARKNNMREKGRIEDEND